ncbi:hypothetical protein TNCV_2972621 [Trichonephila clavipes]|nr:hypothetical protein TNCV_2972621 [Trichonephila clavipes]
MELEEIRDATKMETTRENNDLDPERLLPPVPKKIFFSFLSGPCRVLDTIGQSPFKKLLAHRGATSIFK